jgi:hypothetical protein
MRLLCLLAASLATVLLVAAASPFVRSVGTTPSIKTNQFLTDNAQLFQVQSWLQRLVMATPNLFSYSLSYPVQQQKAITERQSRASTRSVTIINHT